MKKVQSGIQASPAVQKQSESPARDIPSAKDGSLSEVRDVVHGYTVNCAEMKTENLALRKAVEESRTAMEALVRSEQMYREMVESARSIILRWNLEGGLTYINQFGIEFFGYSREELIEKGIGIIIPDRDSSGRDLSQLLADVASDPEKFKYYENENILKSGEKVCITWTNRPMYDSQRKLIEIISIGNDISERKRAEESLVQLNERLVQSAAQLTALNKELEMFGYQVSHDLRAPLRNIERFSLTLLEKYSDKLDSIGQSYLTRIRTSAQKMSRLVEDLLAISRTIHTE